MNSFESPNSQTADDHEEKDLIRKKIQSSQVSTEDEARGLLKQEHFDREQKESNIKDAIIVVKLWQVGDAGEGTIRYRGRIVKHPQQLRRARRWVAWFKQVGAEAGERLKKEIEEE